MPWRSLWIGEVTPFTETGIIDDSRWRFVASRVDHTLVHTPSMEPSNMFSFARYSQLILLTFVVSLFTVGLTGCGSDEPAAPPAVDGGDSSPTPEEGSGAKEGSGS